MLTRTGKGTLSLDGLELEIFLGDLFAECKKESEVDWLEGQIVSCVEIIVREQMVEIEKEARPE